MPMVTAHERQANDYFGPILLVFLISGIGFLDAREVISCELPFFTTPSCRSFESQPCLVEGLNNYGYLKTYTMRHMIERHDLILSTPFHIQLNDVISSFVSTLLHIVTHLLKAQAIQAFDQMHHGDSNTYQRPQPRKAA